MLRPDFVLIVDQHYCKCFGNLPDVVLIVDQHYCKCFGNLPDFVLTVDKHYCKCKCFGNLPDFVLTVYQHYSKCFGNLPDFVLIVDQRYRVMTVCSSQHDLDPSSVRHLLLQHLNLQQPGTKSHGGTAIGYIAQKFSTKQNDVWIF